MVKIEINKVECEFTAFFEKYDEKEGVYKINENASDHIRKIVRIPCEMDAVKNMSFKYSMGQVIENGKEVENFIETDLSKYVKIDTQTNKIMIDYNENNEFVRGNIDVLTSACYFTTNMKRPEMLISLKLSFTRTGDSKDGGNPSVEK